MGNHHDHAGSRAGFSLVELSIVVSIIAVIAGIGLPRLARSRVTANENAALSTLRTVASAQNMTQLSGVIDTNLNGAGEYAYFGEMTGLLPTRVGAGGVPVLGAAGFDEMNPAAMSSTMSQVQADALGDGVVIRSGYVFKMFLGGAQAGGVVPGVPEAPGGGANPGNMPNGSGAEQYWACYAWPVVAGSSGKRVFFMSNEGVMLQFPNLTNTYDGTNAAANIPAYDAALLNGPGLNGMAAPLPPRGVLANDGNLWTVLQ